MNAALLGQKNDYIARKGLTYLSNNDIRHVFKVLAESGRAKSYRRSLRLARTAASACSRTRAVSELVTRLTTNRTAKVIRYCVSLTTKV